MSGDSTVFPILEPNLQISFFYKLQVLRSRYLYEALGSTVQSLDTRAVANN